MSVVRLSLARASIDVWQDDEQAGTEQWWRGILERIREHDVFVVAMSQNFLQSKVCRAELQYAQSLGKPILLEEGKDVLLVSTGPQSARCKEAAERLAQEGISAGVLHLPSIKPLDVEEFVRACQPFKLVVTVEEHNVHGGLGALVAEVLSEHSPRKVIRFGIEERWGESAPNEFLLDLFQLSPARLSERVKQVVQGTK